MTVGVSSFISVSVCLSASIHLFVRNGTVEAIWLLFLVIFQVLGSIWGQDVAFGAQKKSQSLSYSATKTCVFVAFNAHITGSFEDKKKNGVLGCVCCIMLGYYS